MPKEQGWVCSVARAPWQWVVECGDTGDTGAARDLQHLPGLTGEVPWEAQLPVSGMAGAMSVTLGGTGFPWFVNPA